MLAILHAESWPDFPTQLTGSYAFWLKIVLNIFISQQLRNLCWSINLYPGPQTHISSCLFNIFTWIFHTSLNLNMAKAKHVSLFNMSHFLHSSQSQQTATLYNPIIIPHSSFPFLPIYKYWQQFLYAFISSMHFELKYFLDFNCYYPIHGHHNLFIGLYRGLQI